MRKMRDEDNTGLLWRLPVLEAGQWGKFGPAFGYGIGCGIGVGAGVVGGAGLGLGFPGLQFGVGAGAGCGIGIGFGYGLGKGRAYDQNNRYSNIGKPPARRVTNGAELGAILDDIVGGLRRAIENLEGDRRRRG